MYSLADFPYWNVAYRMKIIKVSLGLSCLSAALISGLSAQGVVALQSETPNAPAARSPSATDPPLSRAAYIDGLNNLFNSRDTNRDGIITPVELQQFESAARLAKARSENRALFERLDVDKNGVLYPNEFAALVRIPEATDEDRRLFESFDLNRNRSITVVEFRTVYLNRFDKADADKDGYVTQAEWRLQDNQVAPATGR